MKFSEYNIFKKITFSKNRNDFQRIFILPILFLVLIICINITINYNTCKKQIQSSSESTLTLFSKYCEYKINSVLNSAYFFENNRDISPLLDKTENFTASDAEVLTSFLKDFKNTNALIETAAILNRTANTVITDYGRYSYESFFDKAYIIDGFSASYFKSFRIYSNSKYRIFFPAEVAAGQNTNTIIPIIIREIDQKHQNWIFITISLSRLLKSDMTFLTFSENSEVYMLNNYSGFSYNADDNTGTKIADTPLYQSLIRGESAFTDETSSGKKCLVLSYVPKNSILGYIYYAKIPYSDLYRDFYISLFITVSISVLAILYTLTVTAKNSSEVFVALKNIRKN